MTTMPLIYYYSRWGSDRQWIERRMAVIPDDEQQAVANQYEAIFRDKDGGRKAANTYLQDIAAGHRDRLRSQHETDSQQSESAAAECTDPDHCPAATGSD